MNILTKLELSQEERKYLEEDLDITQEEIKAIEDGNYSVVSDITRLIKILFTCTKYEDAWSNIRANLDKVDFNAIFACPFVQLDRMAIDVYKYMHDNNIIDDASYRYFEVLSGSLNDWDFWKSKLDGKTVEEKLRFLNESYNGVLGVNPYELGLINLTPEQKDYIFGDLKEGEKVDFIFNEAPCVNIDPTLMRALIFNNNLQPSLAGKYFDILFKMYLTMYDFNDEEYTDFYKKFFESIKEYTDMDFGGSTPEDILIDMNISDVNHLIFAVKTMNAIYGIGYVANQKYCSSMEVLINNPLMLMFSNTIIEKVYGDKFKNIKVSNFLKPCNYSLAISYKLNPMFDMSGLIIKNPFPGKFPMIYNYYSGILFYNGKVYYGYDFTNDPENLFGFIEDYKIAKTINDDLFKNFNNEEEYAEFVLTSEEFLLSVIDNLNYNPA